MLRYIGPFLRMNKLSTEQIQSQLFHLSKESVKNIVFNSKCGIILDTKKIKTKTMSSTDINTLDLNSPLLCLYKKANPKLKNKNDKIQWDNDKFKKEISISSNGYMTLSLLELVDYYKKFKDIDSAKYHLSTFYTAIAKKQLEFYASYLRNGEGVFIDKKDCTDNIIGKIQLKDKNKAFKFSEQAILMNAFYKCSTYLSGETKKAYRTFSLDILNMFLEFKEEIYNISFEEKCKLCLNLNIFYTYSKIEDLKTLILDVFDLIYEEFDKSITNKIDYLCLMYLNSALIFKYTNIFKFKNICIKLNEALKKYYNEDLCMFLKESEDKEIKFSCDEIVLYLVSMIYHSYSDEVDTVDEIDEKIISNVFKHQLIDSGLILSWPDIPNVDDVEHYKNFDAKPENLLNEQYFKMPTIASPEINDLAPIFIKNVTYNKNKNSFKKSSSSFDSRKNMYLFFLIIHTFNKTP